MAEEEPVDDELEELDDSLDEDVLDDDVVVDDELTTDVAIEEDEDESADAVPPVVRKKTEDEDDDDEEVDPDDVEADLDRILKDRIAANDDDDEDEAEAAPRPAAETPDGVQPKKAHEFTCTGCFLLVNPGQFGPVDHMECPIGEEICPAKDLLEAQTAKARK